MFFFAISSIMILIIGVLQWTHDYTRYATLRFCWHNSKRTLLDFLQGLKNVNYFVLASRLVQEQLADIPNSASNFQEFRWRYFQIKWQILLERITKAQFVTNCSVLCTVRDYNTRGIETFTTFTLTQLQQFLAFEHQVWYGEGVWYGQWGHSPMPLEN